MPQIDAQATLQPFAVAPLLQRSAARPGLARRLDAGRRVPSVSSQAGRFEADAVVERRSGDLSVADDGPRPPPAAIRRSA